MKRRAWDIAAALGIVLMLTGLLAVLHWGYVAVLAGVVLIVTAIMGAGHGTG